MSRPSEDAAAMVAGGLSRRRSRDRPQFLRELLAHAAAGLVVIEGDREAAESVYRLADAVAVRDQCGIKFERK